MPGTPVRDVIRRERLVHCTPDAMVKEAVEQMCAHCCGSIVLLEDDKVVGIFTERDLMHRVVNAGRDPERTPLSDVMTRDPDTIAADAPVAEAIRAMDEFSYRYLPVLENGRCIGVLSPRLVPFGDVVEMEPEIETRHAIAERLW